MSNPVMTKAKLNTVMKNIVKIVNEQGPNERAILDAIFKKYPGSEITDGEAILDGKELFNIAFDLPFSYKPTTKELEKFSDFDGNVKYLEDIKVLYLTVFLGMYEDGKTILESSFWVEAFDEWSESVVNFSLDLGINDEFVVDIKEGDNKVSILEQQGYKQVGEKNDRVAYQKIIGDVICQISVFKDVDLVEAEFFTKANKVQFRPAIRRFGKSQEDIQALINVGNEYENKPLKVRTNYFTAELVYNSVAGAEEYYRAKLNLDKVKNVDAVGEYLEKEASHTERRVSVFYYFDSLETLKRVDSNIPNVDVVNQVNTEVTPDDQVGEDVLDNIQVSDLVGLEELRNMYTQNGYTIVIANQANIRGFYGDANLNIGVSVTSDNGDDSGETVDVYVNVSGVSKRKDQLIDYLQDKGFDEEGWREFNDLKFNLRELNNQLKLYKGVVDQFNKKADEFDQLKKEERKANKEARKNEPKQEKPRELTDEEKAYLGASVEQLKMELRELGVENPKGVKLALIKQLIELKRSGNPGEMNTIDLIKDGLTKQGFKIDSKGNQFRAELKVGQAMIIISCYKQDIYAIVEGPKGIDVTKGTIGIIRNSGFTLVRNNKRDGARFELDFEGAGKRDVDNFIDKIIKCAKDINEDVSENNFEVIDKEGVNMAIYDITIDRDELEGDLIIRSKALGVTKHVNDEDLLQEMDKLDKLAAKKNIELNWIDLRNNAKVVDDVFGTSDPWEDVKKQEELKIVNNLVQEYRDKIAHRPNVKTNTLLDKDTKFLPGFSVKVNGFEQFDVLIEEQNKKFKATIQPAGDFMSLQGKVQKLVQELKQKGFDAKESGTGVDVFGSYNKNDLSIVYDLSKLIDVVSIIKLDAIEPKVGDVKKQDIDLENLNNLKVAELKQILKDLGIISPQGVKASLVQQIKDIKGNGTKGAEKTPEPAPKAQDEKPQVQPKAVAEEPAPKVETTAKLSMVSDASMKEQLKKLQTIARKWEDDINADPDINLFFLEEPKEFKKYNLPTVALGFVCYDLKLSKQELNQDPVFKRFKKGRGLVGLGDWFTTVAPDGRKCKMCLFLDKDFEKASDENRKTVSRLYRKFRMSESVGTEIEYNGGTFLLESVGNSYARFSKDKKTYLVNLDDLED